MNNVRFVLIVYRIFIVSGWLNIFIWEDILLLCYHTRCLLYVKLNSRCDNVKLYQDFTNRRRVRSAQERKRD